jgi:hypothetical protein
VKVLTSPLLAPLGAFLVLAAFAPGLRTAEADDEAADVVTKLPDAVDDVCVAGGGKYLVVKLAATEGLVVYDTDDKKIAKILKLPSSDFVFGAGGQTAVVYFKENNVLQSWDLKTFEKKKTKPNPVSGVILRIVMGHSRDDQAFVRYSVGTDELSQAGQFLLDTTTLTPLDGDKPANVTGHNGSYRDFVHLRSDKDLSHITEWATSHSPTGVGIYNRKGKTYETNYEHNSDGNLCMGDDGRVYSSTGTIYTTDLQKVGQIQGKMLIPALGGSLVLGLAGDGSLTVYPSGKTTPIGPCGKFPGWHADENGRGPYGQVWAKSTYTFDKHLVFLPARGKILFIPAENDRIVCRTFDLKASLDKAGIDYLVVTSTPEAKVKPGTDWKYQLSVLSKAGEVKYSLELAPDEMSVSATGLVTWKVPAAFSKPEKIVLLVSDKGGEQTYHNFTLEPDAAADKGEKAKGEGEDF